VSAARPFDAVLCAVDGVLRMWDEGEIAEIERRYDLAEGVLAAAVGDERRLAAAQAGLISDEEWRADVAGALVPVCGTERAIDAASDWSASMGHVDEAALEVIRAARKVVPIGLVANATTRLELELVVLGLADEVDAIVSSARIGAVAPDEAFYRTAAGLVGAAPARCLYVDTDPERLTGAAAAGMTSHRYAGREQLAVALAGLTTAG
jgi:putative hydrolase of the HAD superfamily